MLHSNAARYRKIWRTRQERSKEWLLNTEPGISISGFIYNFECSGVMISNLKVGLQVLGRKLYKNTKKSSLYSQSLLIFIHKTPVVESHPTIREITDLLWPRSTTTGNMVYFYMSSSLIYTLKIHRLSFKHSVQ